MYDAKDLLCRMCLYYGRHKRCKPFCINSYIKKVDTEKSIDKGCHCMAFKEVKSEMIKIEEGQVIEGKFLATREVPSTQFPGTNSIVLDIEIDGVKKSTYVTQLVVNKIAEGLIQEGDLIQVEYLGKTKGKNGKSYRDYKVYKDE